MALAALINPAQIVKPKNPDSRINSELLDAFVDAAEQLRKKKSQSDDSEMSATILVAPAIPLQDRKVGLGGMQTTDMADSGKAGSVQAGSVQTQKGLTQSDMASALQFFAAGMKQPAQPAPEVAAKGTNLPDTVEARFAAVLAALGAKPSSSGQNDGAASSDESAGTTGTKTSTQAQPVLNSPSLPAGTMPSALVSGTEAATKAATEAATKAATESAQPAQFTPAPVTPTSRAPVTQQAAPVQGKSDTPDELIRNIPSLTEKKGVKLEKHDVSELASALPMSATTAESATIQRVPTGMYQEPSTTIQDATKKQSEVLAIRDKNAEGPKETKVSFLGGTVTISAPAKETGRRSVITSNNDIRDILVTHGGEIPAGIDAVESSIDKQPKQRQSANPHFADDADE